ncbi:class A beta-lactamase [Nocardia sp. CDC159]|uniref:Beta-lactamase n=1 Tax=Nocardia pulmonis TaxID=2951408 RepID=A0A9X2IY36_9NOCA|nr:MULTISPECIES: class A beta-lactamase [Nocardia]MCM6776647.1 class A beta-lactamase [Nocardia pulmonis]MCM6789204.1 class A beta-lactamase [Nocardia sp. CDC159]
MTTISRRNLLATAALVTLAGCGADKTAPVTATRPRPAPLVPELLALERKFDARLGVYAVHTGTGATIAHRADERFAFCSAFKGVAAAAVLSRNPLSHLDMVVRYSEADLTENAAITPKHVATGMTIRDLCDAAVRFSDGTAGNLLLRDLGGPAQLTAYARTLGDTVTRMDRIEPFITEATPGDPRDTSSPRAFGTAYHKIVLGDALPEDKRAFLRDLLERNVTSAQRLRAGLPATWRIANKTGTGDYGTLNDIAIAWPPASAPLVISTMSSKTTRDAEYNQAVLAETAAYLAAILR